MTRDTPFLTSRESGAAVRELAKTGQGLLELSCAWIAEAANRRPPSPSSPGPSSQLRLGPRAKRYLPGARGAAADPVRRRQGGAGQA